jgi:hypothetical protein
LGTEISKNIGSETIALAHQKTSTHIICKTCKNRLFFDALFCAAAFWPCSSRARWLRHTTPRAAALGVVWLRHCALAPLGPCGERPLPRQTCFLQPTHPLCVAPNYSLFCITATASLQPMGRSIIRMACPSILFERIQTHIVSTGNTHSTSLTQKEASAIEPRPSLAPA